MTDSDLLCNYRMDGNAAWMAEIYRRYSHLAFGVCLKYLKNREEAKDALTSIFEKLLHDLRKHEVQNFQGWLYAVCKHHCLNSIRHTGKYSEIAVDDFTIGINHLESEESELFLAEEKESLLSRMERAVLELSESQRRCIELFYIEKMSYKQITEATGMSLNEVKSHLQNGKRNLSLSLKEQR